SLDEVERTLQEGGFFDLGSSILIKLVEKNPLNLTEQETHVATRSTKLTIHQQKALNVIADPELRRVLVMFVKCINK
ncbi:MAG: hypothetical protein M1114_00870, partial [Candidatus Dependentiae bacterium]|nr:hypothetical protein [Candidatus Dependentiae bacterium]